jgi:hypothetical protein
MEGHAGHRNASREALRKSTAAAGAASLHAGPLGFGDSPFPPLQPQEEIMANYQVTIQMSDSTVDTLQQDGFLLYGFKGVQGPPGGSPLVWFQTTSFSQNTVVQWSESYQAYTSTTTVITPNTVITASADYPIDLGQSLNVTNPQGTGIVVQGTLPTAIEINNQTSTPFTCGISQQQANGGFQAICAFPLLGNDEDVIAPVEQVFLMFSTLPVDTGTVIEQSYSPGVLVDLTGNPQVAVSYDANLGWTKAPGVTPYPANQNLVPLLIGAATGSVVAR